MKELERRLRNGVELACNHTQYLTTDGSDDVYTVSIDSELRASAKSLIEALAKLNDLLEAVEPEPQEPCVRHESDGSRYTMNATQEAALGTVGVTRVFLDCKHCGVLFRKP